MKSLLPSLREKKRYMAFEIISKNEIKENEIKDAIKKSALETLGTINYGKAGIKIIKTGKKGIVKVSNKFVNHMKVAMMLIKNINNEKVTFRVNKVSGILNKIKEAD